MTHAATPRRNRSISAGASRSRPTAIRSPSRPTSSALAPGASALLVGRDGMLIAVGRLLLAPAEMLRFRRGVAAWVTSHTSSPEPDDEETAAEPVGPEDEPAGPPRRR